MPKGHFHEDLSNKEYNGVILIKYLYNKPGYRPVWLCKCSCGKEFEAIGHSVKSGRKRSCGCKPKRKGKNHPNWKGYEGISGQWWASFIQDCWQRRKRKKKIEVTIEYLWNLFVKQDKKCSYTGEVLSFQSKKDGNGKTVSLDRIDSSKHYEEGNVEWVHKKINIMKNNMSKEEFISWCCKVADYHRNKVKNGNPNTANQ